ncbi:DUF4011 domain-containing protein [Gordonia sp. TBRC 11910]|uniref:DUF4011 domain-containing protein n=1 Tax=Gordonia asplenii TaxID=2725283 RepID=A0A848KS42_9ACTN|nr:DUF4011 domain-containing protein [Gordonia asplenii]NMO01250.1 DUF4011 domain-containing protein [Gordonia asplenii]
MNYVLSHNSVPIIQRVEITNIGEGPKTDVIVRAALLGLETDDDDAPEWTQTVTALRSGESVGWELIRDVNPERAHLRRLTEAYDATLEFSLAAGLDTTPGIFDVPVRLLAHNEWIYTPACVESLASFVQPNSEAIRAVLDAASTILGEQTGDPALQGYQEGPVRAGKIAAAVYSALSARGLRYSNPPASFETTGQKVRTADEVLSERFGTCIDLAVLYAGTLEAVGLHPQIWIVEGHAFVGFWRDEIVSPTAVISDPNQMDNLAKSGNVVLSEAKFYSPSTAPTFAAAVAEARQHLSYHDRLRCVIDIAAARRARITPIPTSADADRSETVTANVCTATLSASPVADLTLPAELADERDGDQVLDTTDTAPGRVKRWKRSLLDLSTRNRLLNLRTSREVVYLTLPDRALAKAADCVHSGKRFTLRASDDLGNLQQLSGIRSAAELPVDEITTVFDQRREVFAALSESNYASTLKNLQRTARMLLEETGSANLYLTLGSLVHETKSGARAQAPLFLLPVRIAGGEGNSSFTVTRNTTETAEPNFCLTEWLRVAHNNVIIDALSSPPIDDNRGLDLPSALTRIRADLAQFGLPFRVEETAAIAICKFGTFGMWQDLQVHWNVLEQSPLVHHLTYRPGETFIDPHAENDDSLQTIPVDETAHALPSVYDGSQLRAVELSAQGRTFVLEGPPGTGKSQTITNLIARNLDAGRTVLFVAEKQAALDVVRTRLDKIGLRPFLLDLHGAGQRGENVRAQLKDSLEFQAQYNEKRFEAELARWRSKHRALDLYPGKIHDRNAVGDSLWSATDTVTASPGQKYVNLPTRFVSTATPEQVNKIRDGVVEFSRLAIPADIRHDNPWVLASSIVDDDVLVNSVRHASTALVRAQSDSIAARILSSLPTPGDALTLVSRARTEADTFHLTSSDLEEFTDARWTQRMANANRQLADFQTQSHLLAATFHGDFLNAGDPAALAETVRAAPHGLFGKRKRIEQAQSELRRALRPGVELALEDAIPLLDQIPGFRSSHAEVKGNFSTVLGPLLPVGWEPLSPSAHDEIEGVRQHISTTLQFAGDHAQIWHTLRSLDRVSASTLDTITGAVRAWNALLAATGADSTTLSRWQAGQGWFASWAHYQPKWQADLDDRGPNVARRFLALNAALAPLRAYGLDDFANALLSGEVPHTEAEVRFLSGVAQASIAERTRVGGLSDFATALQDGEVSDFVNSAQAMRTELAHSLPARLAVQRQFDPDRLTGSYGKLRGALDGKRKVASVRRLMQDYGREIVSAAPCFLVSPASLAQFVPPGSVTFDLVVFDEASQVTVAQAIGALGRANSAVIVGDSKQMPPTSIGIANSDISDDAEDDGDTSGAVPEDLESILSESVESGIPRLWLSWHYRSQDESLIAFSNDKYYESKLATLPSPGQTADTGVELRRVHGHFNREDRTHEFRTNRVEAEGIVTEIRRLVNSEVPQRSIGVVTFNRQQQDLVLNLLEESGDPTIIALLQPEATDGLFVKNLENVQGDERDVILFSTAFSKPPNGDQLPLNFGPLTRAGGERRLNVAVTRARRKVLVFSSFDPTDIDLSRTRSIGMAHLRRYLETADSRTPTITTPDTKLSGSLQSDIADALRAKGFEVRVNYGMSEFVVDIAVRAQTSDDWQIAVMLDGPQWRKRPTVTDRDVMPSLLESIMHWPEVIRVWLPDWLQHRADVTSRIAAAVERAEFDRIAAGLEAAGVTASPDTTNTGDPLPKDSMLSEPIRSVTTAPQTRIDYVKRVKPIETPSLVVDGAREAEPTGSALPAPVREPIVMHDNTPVAMPYQLSPRDALGVRDELDNQHSRALRDKISRGIVETIEAEGPVEHDRLCKIVVRRFGWDKTTAPRRAFVAKLIPAGRVYRDESLGDFVWPDSLDPASWRAFRQSRSKERPLNEICAEEIINALCFAAAQRDCDIEQLTRDTLMLFGQGRLTETAGSRVGACIDRAVGQGRMSLVSERYRVVD